MKNGSVRSITKTYFALAVATAVLCFSVGYYTIQNDHAYHREAQRLEVTREVHRVASALDEKLFGMELVADRLATYATLAAEVPEEALVQAADQLVEHHPEVVTVAIAPGLKVTHVSPLEGNERVIGLEYWKVPSQIASVARAYREQAPVFDGPINLIQGGRGYILRYPVFVPYKGYPGRRFWGIISVVLSEQGLLGPGFEDVGAAEGLTLAIRELYPSGRDRKYLVGDASVFAANPIVGQVSTLGGNWQIGAVPRAGWDATSPNTLRLAAGTLAAMLFLVGTLLTIMWFAIKRQEAHAILSHAIDVLDEGFVMYDREDRMVMYNSRFVDYHKSTMADRSLGMTYEELVRDAAAKGTFIDAHGREEEWVQERLAAHRNGESSIMQMASGRWLKVSEAKTPDGFTVGIRSDVSAQKHAQMTAEAANRQKTEFLSNVTHELRTPLTVISGYAAFLAKKDVLPHPRKLMKILKDDKPDLEEAQRLAKAHASMVATQGQKVLDSAKHMLVMVNDLLDWAKVENGNLNTDPEAVSVRDLVGRSVEELQPQARTKGLTLATDCVGVDVWVDPARLKQVLYNLVGNAIKFTNQGSITVSVTTRGGDAVFVVEDTGCGIASDDLDRIFERFQQVDGSETRNHNGFGLGLSIAKEIVLLHGGQMRATSTLGHGSRFEFTLPLARPSAVSAPETVKILQQA